MEETLNFYNSFPTQIELGAKAPGNECTALKHAQGKLLGLAAFFGVFCFQVFSPQPPAT